MAMLVRSSNFTIPICGMRSLVVRWKRNEGQISKTLQKMLQKHNNTKNKRKTKHHFDWLPKYTAVTEEKLQKKRVVSAGQQRRCQQVGKVLYDYIVQIINTGELDPYLAAHDVEITKVKVEPDLSTMNVYWSATGSEDDIHTQEILKKSQGKLRHLLTTYHLLNHVPHITFVKDKAYVNVKKVEEILKSMDLGPDLDPLDLSIQLLETTNYSRETNTTSSSLDLPENNLSDSEFENLADSVSAVTDSPSYNHKCENLTSCLKSNIYGLQHDEIMKNLVIKKSKQKMRPAIDESDTNIHAFKQNFTSKPLHQSYEQLAVKLKKPKVVKARYLCRESEQIYINEEFGIKEHKQVELEDEIKCNDFGEIENFIEQYSDKGRH